MAVGIIVEWNPFHHGHKIHIDETKKLFPDEEIIAVMSGKYVQRGELAIISFEDRCEIAKSFGVNTVLEIPQESVLQSAKWFALGAIKTLSDAGVDKIVFGSETNEISLLQELSEIEKNPDFRKTLRRNMKKGNSYKVAYSMTTEELSGKSLQLPNDILAFEYIKAIKELNVSITPYSIKREDNYHDSSLDHEVVSATAIREALKNGEDVSRYVPYDITKYKIITSDHLFDEMVEVFNTETIEEIATYKLVSEGIENRFAKIIPEAKSYDEFINMANSTRYSSSRIKRTMVNIILKNKK